MTPTPGRVVDLSISGNQIPNQIIVDTNLLVEWMIVPFLGALPQHSVANAQRTAQFFKDLTTNNGIGLVTPTVFNEFVHIAIQFKYSHEWLQRQSPAPARTNRQFIPWKALYKQDPTILQGFSSDLEMMRTLLTAGGLVFLSPDQYGPIPSGRSHDEELVHLTGRFGLDSNDASILLEALRYGYTDLITLDADMQRAQSDFTIYTWN